MTFTTHLRRIKINFQNMIVLPITLKNATHKILKTIILLLGLNREPKPQIKKCFKCLGFGHIANNCPKKRTMMVKGGIIVSDNSDRSSRSNSPTPSKTPSVNKCEIPCEGECWGLFKNLLIKPKEKIFSTSAAISTSYVP